MELKELQRWVVWKYEKRDGKETKVLHDPKSGRHGKTTDPNTWASYGEAIVAMPRYRGLGLVIDEPYVGIDLDKCRDPKTGRIEPWAQKIVQELDSYTEISPSGTGLHIWVLGSLPKGRRRAGRVEIYGGRRYFTVTGEYLAGTPTTLEARDLKSIHSRIESLDPQYREPEKSKKPKNPAIDLGITKFEALMAGEWKGLYRSHSEADLALCGMLARKHECDEAKIDSEFRRSRLYREEKWNRDDYRDQTINKAIDFVRTNPRPTIGQASQPLDVSEWRKSFRSYEEMDAGELRFLIRDFLPEGITFVGGLPGTGKTWVCLSIAKALVTGERFLGHFEVLERVPVIYLVPECGEKAVRTRLEKMRLTHAGEYFLCRTMKDGKYPLDDQRLLAAIRAMKPVVILDTAIRFSTAEDENSATDNQQLANWIFGMLREGARVVIAIHHSVKSSGQPKENLTLETALRGSGDFGALCDTAWGLRCSDSEKLCITVKCVKSRDFEPPSPFQIMGRPYIDRNGDFIMVAAERQDSERADADALDKLVRENPNVTYDEIAEKTQIAKGRVKDVAERAGWRKTHGKWERVAGHAPDEELLPF
jgi:hypothetical protein